MGTRLDCLFMNTHVLNTCFQHCSASDMVFLIFPLLFPLAPPSPVPAYSDQSTSGTLTYGLNVNLRVNNYTGAIQWWHNGTAITGSTAKYTLVPSSSTLQINNVEFSDAGIYQAELLDATPVRQFSIFDITVVGKFSEEEMLTQESEFNLGGSTTVALQPH